MNKDDGWIKLYRQLQDNPLWTCEAFTRGQAWVDLLLLANHKQSYFYKRGVKIMVARGQVGRSEVELSERWKWSRKKVRKFINDLKEEQQLTQQKSVAGNTLTIIKYDEYQKKEQQTTQQRNSRGTAEDTTEAHIQECKEYKEYKECKKEKEPLSWIEQANPLYLDFCERYHAMLSDNGKVTKSVNWQTKAWYDSVRLLIEADGVDLNKLNKALNFLLTHLLDDYCPQVWSMKALRAKWVKLAAYMEKNGCDLKPSPQFDMSTKEGRKAKSDWFYDKAKKGGLI